MCKKNINKQIETLLKLVKENPELEIISATHYDVCCEDWGYWIGKIEKVEIDYFFDCCDKWIIGKEETEIEIEEQYEKECQNLSDEELNVFIDSKFKEFEKNGEIKKAIIIYIELP